MWLGLVAKETSQIYDWDDLSNVLLEILRPTTHEF